MARTYGQLTTSEKLRLFNENQDKPGYWFEEQLYDDNGQPIQKNDRPETTIGLGSSALLGTLGTTLFQDTPWGNLFANIADRDAEAKSEAETRAWNYWLMQQQMNFNSSEAQKQRDWEQMMSNTALQRQMQDMTSAGLNPMMFSGSTGAQVPSGATASASGGTGGQRLNVNVFGDTSKQNHTVIRDVVNTIMNMFAKK